MHHVTLHMNIFCVNIFFSLIYVKVLFCVAFYAIRLLHYFNVMCVTLKVLGLCAPSTVYI